MKFLTSLVVVFGLLAGSAVAQSGLTREQYEFTARQFMSLSINDRMAVQSCFQDMGFYAGAIDGLFGPGTLSAFGKALGYWMNTPAGLTIGGNKIQPGTSMFEFALDKCSFSEYD